MIHIFPILYCSWALANYHICFRTFNNWPSNYSLFLKSSFAIVVQSSSIIFITDCAFYVQKSIHSKGKREIKDHLCHNQKWKIDTLHQFHPYCALFWWNPSQWKEGIRYFLLNSVMAVRIGTIRFLPLLITNSRTYKILRWVCKFRCHFIFIILIPIYIISLSH